MTTTPFHAHPPRRLPRYSDVQTDVQADNAHLRVGRRLLATCALVGLVACGGAAEADTDARPEVSEVDVDQPDTTAGGDTTTAPANVPSAQPTIGDAAPDATDPPVTDASPEPIDPPGGADEPVTTTPVPSIENTPELTAFADTHGDLVTEWSATLNAFGEEAIDHIDDVSAAPSAPAAAELSDALAAAIGETPTDDVLVTLRSFAQGVSTAIGFAVDGDQESALSVFLGLQTQSDTLTAILDHFEA